MRTHKYKRLCIPSISIPFEPAAISSSFVPTSHYNETKFQLTTPRFKIPQDYATQFAQHQPKDLHSRRSTNN